MKFKTRNSRDLIITTREADYVPGIVDYFDRMLKTGWKGISPTLIVNRRIADRKQVYNKLISESFDENQIQDFFDFLSFDCFYVLERNHRAVASCLAGIPIQTRELKTEADLRRFKKSKEGIEDDFDYEDKCLVELANDFEIYLLGCCDGNFDSVREKAEYLVESGEFPQRVVKHYKGLSKATREKV